jgi:hypothetical protein
MLPRSTVIPAFLARGRGKNRAGRHVGEERTGSGRSRVMNAHVRGGRERGTHGAGGREGAKLKWKVRG